MSEYEKESVTKEVCEVRMGRHEKDICSNATDHLRIYANIDKLEKLTREMAESCILMGNRISESVVKNEEHNRDIQSKLFDAVDAERKSNAAQDVKLDFAMKIVWGVVAGIGTFGLTVVIFVFKMGVKLK
jgi:hypothetical protein